MDAEPQPTAASGVWRARLAGLPPGLTDAISLFLIMRVALGLVAAYFWWKGGLPGPCHFELARNGWLTMPPLADDGAAFPLVGVWQRWDACWYGKIATFGYEPAEMSANFWPMFPILTGLNGPAGRRVRRVRRAHRLGGGLRRGDDRPVPAREPRLRGDDRPADRPADLHLPERLLPVRAVHRGPLPRPRGLVYRDGPGAAMAAGGRSRTARRAHPDPGRVPRPAHRLGGPGRRRRDGLASMARPAVAVDRHRPVGARWPRRRWPAGGVRRVLRVHGAPSPARPRWTRRTPGAARSSSRHGTWPRPHGIGPWRTTIRCSS